MLPIVSLVRQSRLRNRLAALENALDDQKHTIDDLERRLTQLKKDAVAAAPRRPATCASIGGTRARGATTAAADPAARGDAATDHATGGRGAATAESAREASGAAAGAAENRAARHRAAPPPPDMWRNLTSGPSSLLKAFDWEQLVGVKLFSAVAGIALVLAAIFFLRYSLDRGWLSPAVRVAIGIVVATALLVVCELRAAHRYRVTANALDAAAIAILFSTFFAAHSLWNLIPSTLTFALLGLVTVLAVLLSIRHDSIFIAVLGLVGGFATPALLSTGENRPIPLFVYLLLLNVGLAWVAVRKKWPVLTILTLALTTAYQWGWVVTFLSSSDLTLGMGIFLVFSVTSFVALTLGRADRGGAMDLTLEQSGLAASAMPLAFAIFLAAVPRYGAHTGLLFGFLLLIVVGLSAVAIVRRDDRLHAIGATATVLVFAIWLATSYATSGWRVVVAFTVVFATSMRSRRLSPTACGVRSRGSARAPHMPRLVLLFVFPVIVRIEPAAAVAAGAVRRVVRRARGDRVARARHERGGPVLRRRIFRRGGRSVVVGDTSGGRSPRRCGHHLCGVRAVLPGRAARLAAHIGRRCIRAGEAGRCSSPAWRCCCSSPLVRTRRPRSGASRCCWRSSTRACSSRAPPAPCRCCRSWARCSHGSCWPCGGTTPRPPSACSRRCSCSSVSRSIMLGGHAWAHANSARAGAPIARPRFSFRHGVYLALVGQFFLFFVARNPQWAAPPWPLFGALAVMTLATTAAALNVVMPELHAGGVIAAALVVFSFSQSIAGRHGPSRRWRRPRRWWRTASDR